MFIEPTTFIFLVVTAAALAVILLILVIVHVRTLERTRKADELNHKLTNELNENPVHLLEEAHGKALEIIDRANKEANAILSKTKAYQIESNSSLEDTLASVEKIQQEAFTKASEELQNAYRVNLTEAKDQCIKQ